MTWIRLMETFRIWVSGSSGNHDPCGDIRTGVFLAVGQRGKKTGVDLLSGPYHFLRWAAGQDHGLYGTFDSPDIFSPISSGEQPRARETNCLPPRRLETRAPCMSLNLFEKDGLSLLFVIQHLMGNRRDIDSPLNHPQLFVLVEKPQKSSKVWTSPCRNGPLFSKWGHVNGLTRTFHLAQETGLTVP